MRTENSVYETIAYVKNNPASSFEYWILLGSVLNITEEATQ